MPLVVTRASVELPFETLREVLLKQVVERAWVRIVTKPRSTLSLIDLRKDGCVRLGTPTDIVNARSHAAGRALGRTIRAEHKDIDGFLFSSRLTGADVYALNQPCNR